jgi:hypothetical protein
MNFRSSAPDVIVPSLALNGHAPKSPNCVSMSIFCCFLLALQSQRSQVGAAQVEVQSLVRYVTVGRSYAHPVGTVSASPHMLKGTAR